MFKLKAMMEKGLIQLVEVRIRLQQVTQRGKAIVNIYPP